MIKIIQPCTIEIAENNFKSFHIKMSYKEGKLSLYGVIGAKRNGDAHGSCGQNLDELKRESLKLAKGWTKEDIEKLYTIWKRWHLNDINSQCEHQRQLGWEEKGLKEVTHYKYELNYKTILKQEKIKKEIIKLLDIGKTVKLNKEQIELINLPYFFNTFDELANEDFYKLDKKVSKKLLHLTPEEHPEGILTKKCPICGYECGTEWLFEEVPDNIIEWLFSRPKPENRYSWK